MHEPYLFACHLKTVDYVSIFEHVLMDVQSDMSFLFQNWRVVRLTLCCLNWGQGQAHHLPSLWRNLKQIWVLANCPASHLTHLFLIPYHPPYMTFLMKSLIFPVTWKSTSHSSKW